MPELETRDLKGVEIFDVGTWNGLDWTSEQLDEMVTNFHALKGVVDPPAKLGHGDHQELLEREGFPAVGWVQNLYRAGTKLVADFAKVPDKFAALIEAGAYRKVSSEIFFTLKIGEQVFHNVLGGVAFLGEELPAVKTLSDIFALYRQNTRLVFDAERDVTRVDYQAKERAPRRAKETPMKSAQFRDLVARIGRAVGLRTDHELGPDESLEQRQSALRDAVEAAFPSGGEYGWPWIAASYDDHVVIDRGGTFWQVPYTVGEDGAVTLGQAFEVEQTWSPKKRTTTTDAGSTGENEEEGMASLKRIATVLGLAENASEDQIVAAIGKVNHADAPSTKEDCEAGGGTWDADAGTCKMPNAAQLAKDLREVRQTLAKNTATTVVEQAIRDRKVAPAKKEWATAFATKDLAGFQEWAKDAPELFKAGEAGSVGDAPAPKSAGEEINALISAAMTADTTLTFAAAMDKVTREHPELVAKYREESRGVTAAARS